MDGFMPEAVLGKESGEKEKRAASAVGTSGRVPFVPVVRRVNKGRYDRLLVFMPHGFQQFFAFVLSDFATAFFSQIAHVEDSWL